MNTATALCVKPYNPRPPSIISVTKNAEIDSSPHFPFNIINARISLAVLTVSLSLLGVCKSGLDRSSEDAPNQRAGIEVTQSNDGVELRLSDTVLFDFDKTTLRSGTGVAIGRAGTLLRRSGKPVLVERDADNVGSREYNQ
jgi:hypothetical protein